MTYNNLYIRNRVSVHPGETAVIDGTYKTCKLNHVRINNQVYPSDYSSIDGWTYYDMDTCERKQIPDDAEILIEWW